MKLCENLDISIFIETFLDELLVFLNKILHIFTFQGLMRESKGIKTVYSKNQTFAITDKMFQNHKNPIH